MAGGCPFLLLKLSFSPFPPFLFTSIPLVLPCYLKPSLYSLTFLSSLSSSFSSSFSFSSSLPPRWPLPPNNCQRSPFFSTSNTITLNFMGAPQFSSQLGFYSGCRTLRCDPELHSGGMQLSRRIMRCITALHRVHHRIGENCTTITFCTVHCTMCIIAQSIAESASLKWVELHYNYCPIRTIGGEWGQEIDTSSKLHPTPSSTGLRMLSKPKNISSTHFKKIYIAAFLKKSVSR